MDELQRVDELYRAFCQTLQGPLRAEAQNLAYTLGLAPARDTPWSAVFSNTITLAAPALVAEAMPHVPVTTVREALLAHMLAVIDAFATDRLKDGQVQQTWQIEALLAHVRRARDLAIQRLAPAGPDATIDFQAAEELTLHAIEEERSVLAGGAPAHIRRYRAISRAKQRLGIPATVALATAAGWDGRRRGALARMLESIWVGMQYWDDAMDWEEDWARGCAWALTLARGLGQGGSEVPEAGLEAQRTAPGAPFNAPFNAPSSAPSSASFSALFSAPTPEPVPAAVRRFVLESGVLALLLRSASQEMRSARRRADALGLQRVASWAAAREEQTSELARCEVESPGYANRARVLSVWAKAVLA